jgi:prepilin signal peptidase PulO-like enzyme (type II secretory pathway)
MQNPLISNILIFLLGWGSGVLVNYLANVLPAGKNLSAPVCAQCGIQQPLANYLLWPRRCPQCGHRRTNRAWLVEACMILCAFWLWYSLPASFQSIGQVGFVLGLIVAAYFALIMVIDIEHHLILQSTSLVGAFLGLATGVARIGLTNSLLGGLAGFLAMFALFLLGGLFAIALGRLRGQPIHEVAFGFGDVLLGGIIGLMVGWPDIFRSLFITIISAGVFSLLYIVSLLIQKRYRTGSTLPYAPFLILGALATMIK